MDLTFERRQNASSEELITKETAKMAFVGKIKINTRKILGPVLGISVLVYFLFHMVHGDRGLLALIQLEESVSQAKVVAMELRSTKNLWKHRVALLHPSKLDPDMLEERVIKMLNFGHKNDLVFILGEPKQSG